jgi:hypothetical protein
MVCDKYKKALTKAAASGAALPNAAREHVETCPHCGIVLANTQTLFAAVDAGLHRAANVQVRSSFLSDVKANLAAETVPTRNAIPGWVLVCATGALALAAAFLSLPSGIHDQARTEAITVASKIPTGAGVELSLAPEHKTHYTARNFKSPEQQNISGASHEPEVLVQPEEEEFLKAFYVVRNPAGDARVVLTADHEITPKPLVIEQIEVRDLKIENLDDESGLTQTGTK